jgi:hypothetical protein
MECLEVRTVAEGPQWQYELKLDGYRAIEIAHCIGLSHFRSEMPWFILGQVLAAISLFSLLIPPFR